MLQQLSTCVETSTVSQTVAKLEAIFTSDSSDKTCALQETMRMGTSLLEDLKKLKKLETLSEKWLLELNNALLSLAEKTSETVPKLNRKMIQGIVEAEKLNCSCTERSLQVFLKSNVDSMPIGQVIIWNCLIDLSPSCQKVVENDLDIFLTTLRSHFDDLLWNPVMKDVDDKSWTMQRHKELHAVTKLSLQLFQRFGTKLQEDDALLKNDLSSVLKHLIRMLQHEYVAKDCSLLAGTSICFLLKAVAVKEMAAFYHLYTKLSSDAILDNPLQCTENTFSTSPPESLSFGHLSLLNGMMSRADAGFLCTSINPSTPSPLFAWVLTSISHVLQLSQHHFHSFQLLLQWFTKISRLLPQFHDSHNTYVFAGNDHLVNCALNIIWGHLDSPVEGVNECIASCFKSLLAICKEEHFKHDDPIVGNLSCDLLGRVLSMSWQVKGKHILLSCLLDHCLIAEVFEKDPCMVEKMRVCLGTNYLASPATDLYLVILKKISEQSNGMDLWKKYCLPYITSSLKSSDCLIQHHVTHFWLPVSFKQFPQCFPVLLEDLKGSSGDKLSLQAITAALRVARSQRLLKEMPVEIASSALSHIDIQVRRDAFTLICNSPKKAEPLTKEEIFLLKSHLPNNLSVDSAPFRQQLQNDLHNAIVRARDSSLALLRPGSKYKATNTSDLPSDVELGIGFIDWLWKLCVNNLHPGANFQRLKTCLDVMWIILDGVIYQEQCRGRKAGCPETARALLSVAQSLGYLHFFNPESTLGLLSCALHGADDIREQALKILAEFFPWPLPIEEGPKETPDSNVSALLSRALSLCKSCQARESQSGAGLCSLIFSKHVLSSQNAVEFTYTAEDSWNIEISPSERNCAVSIFLGSLASQIELSLLEAQTNVLNVAKYHPTQGFLLALQLCLKQIPSLGSSCSIQSMLDRVIKASNGLVELALQVFGKNTDQNETAPSFEQMSESIESVIKSCLQGSGIEYTPSDGTALTLEHQLINTWCWLNIRESSLLLGRLVTLIPANCSEENLPISVDTVRDIGSTFIKILTSCRHRGAIEGCHLGFGMYCSHLLSCTLPSLFNIPSDLLDQVLGQVICVSEGSVTRRSAGLPLIVQAILASETRNKQPRLLQRSVSSLLSTIQVPLPTACDQRLDLAPVHAMHMLKAIVQEAGLSHSVMPYIGQSAELALSSMGSPHWAIRNAATQLFGALMNRMLGQKKTSDDGHNSTTVYEFYTSYPTLWKLLLKLIQNGCPLTNSMSLHPSLFPALTILAKLNPGISSPEVDKLIAEVLPPVVRLAHSPILAVRHLGAHALVSLVPTSKAARFIVDLFESISKEKHHMNMLHGTLCQIQFLLKSLKSRDALSGGNSQEILIAVEQNLWIASSENPCALVRCVFVAIITELSVPEVSLTSTIQTTMESVAEEVLTQPINGVGSDQLRSTVIHWLLQSTHSDGKSLLAQLSHCLSSSFKEVVDSTLEWLKDTHHEDSFCQISGDVYMMLLQKWLQDDSGLTLLETLAGIQSYLPQDGFNPEISMEVFPLIARKMQLDALEASPQTPVLIRISAPFLCHMCSKASSPELIVTWARLALEYSDPLQTDSFRLHVAHALQNAGSDFLHWAFHKENFPILSSVLPMVVNLLQDENEEIRQVTQETLLAFLPLQNEQADSLLQRFFKHSLPLLFQHGLSGLQALWNLMSIGENDFKSNFISQHSRWEEVFAPQESNPYFEQWLLNSAILDALKDHCNRGNIKAEESMITWLTEQLNLQFSEFSEAIQIVKSSPVNAVLNQTCDKRYFTPSLSVIHGVQFLLMISCKVSSAIDHGAWNCLISELKKTGNFHLVLKNSLDEIDSLLSNSW